MFDRILPPSYLDPLRSVGPGYEVFQALAELGERISLAVGRLECAQFITLAQGGQRARVPVEFFRPALTGSVTIKVGTIVRTSVGGRQFSLVEDVVFGPADLVVPGTVEAIADGYEWNVVGPATTAGGESIPGEIDVVELPLQDPPFGDPSILVRQTGDPTQEGRAAALDGLGADRDLRRNPGEGDVRYAARVRSLPDTVTPDAIVRQLHKILDPLGLAFDFIETFELRYQTCYDAPDAPIAGSPFAPNTFTYDDPRPEFPFFNRWLDVEDQHGAFVVVVQDPLPIEEHAMVYDDPGAVLADFAGRAHSAYDVDPVGLNPAVIEGAYDGTDVGQAALFLNLSNLLEEIKAGGVKVALELDTVTAVGP